MVLRKIPTNKAATAGTNYLFIDIPVGAALISIAAQDHSRSVQTRIDLARISDNPADGDLDAIPLFHNMQDGPYVTLWHAAQPWEVSDWRRVVATFYECTALDALSMAVAYDD